MNEPVSDYPPIIVSDIGDPSGDRTVIYAVKFDESPGFSYVYRKATFGQRVRYFFISIMDFISKPILYNENS